jgi:hypothetical protein
MRRPKLVVLAALAVALAALAAAGCGGESGDLMSFEITGGPAGTTGHTIVVTGDGRGSCDKGDEKLLPSDRVIDARVIEADVTDLARRADEYPPKAGARRYTLSTDDGDVRWSEGSSGLPGVLPKAQLLALQLERLLCR